MSNLFRRYFNSATDDKADQAVIDKCRQLQPEARQADSPESLKKKIIVAEGENIVLFAGKLLSLLAKHREISQGIFYRAEKEDNKNILRFVSGYACDKEPEDIPAFEFGDGFPGQVAIDCKPMIISEVPQDYLSIVSGLGNAAPASIILFPVIDKMEVLAVIELASFHQFTSEDESLFMDLASYLAPLLKKIAKE